MDDSTCARNASEACYFAFQPQPGAGLLHYFASVAPGATGPTGTTTAPTSALIVVHGRSRDANKTFDAALEAVRQADVAADTLVVAPLFQVGKPAAERCRTPGVPEADPHEDLLWTCGSWMEGGAADDGSGPSSFAVLDRLIGHIAHRWPEVRVVTIAGFSAGAQLVQHAIGFAAPPPAGLRLRYVVADPSSWLYFDPVRPAPIPLGAGRSSDNHLAAEWQSCAADASSGGGDVCSLRLVEPELGCPAYNRWKYGTDRLPAAVGVDAPQARARYAAADIDYLEGGGDTGTAREAAYRVLDTSCAALLQGPFRLQRGLGYAFYDRKLLTPFRPHRLTLVPGCAHDVACVFKSPAARAALVGLGVDGPGRAPRPSALPERPPLPASQPSQSRLEEPFRPRP